MKKYKVLIVEDEHILREANAMRLKRDGFEVFTAEDGEMALKKVKECTPDLILLDILMPKKDGFQFCRELKSNSAYQKIKVVALTAKAELVDKRKAIDAGIDLYLTKPIASGDLLSRIMNALEHQ